MSKILTRFVLSPRPPENINVLWIKDTDDEFVLHAYGDNLWEPTSMTKNELLKIVAQLKEEVKAATVYISANDYQMLIDSELVDPDVEYNIYEE